MADVIRFTSYRRKRYRPRSRRRLWTVAGAVRFLLALIAAVGLGLLALAPAPDSAVSDVHFTMCSSASNRNCVIDGDTIRYHGEKIRLADIDTPETHEPRCPWEAERGRRATRRLLELLNEGPIELVAAGGRDRDRYGRALRIIERDGRSVGAILVAEGLARRWDGTRRSWCG